MELKYFHIEKPTAGKFIAFFNDGSGATLFIMFDNGEAMDAEGEQTDLDYIMSEYSSWCKMPDDFRYFFEDKEILSINNGETP